MPSNLSYAWTRVSRIGALEVSPVSECSFPLWNTVTVPEDAEITAATASVLAVIRAAAACRVPRPGLSATSNAALARLSDSTRSRRSFLLLTVTVPQYSARNVVQPIVTRFPGLTGAASTVAPFTNGPFFESGARPTDLTSTSSSSQRCRLMSSPRGLPHSEPARSLKPLSFAAGATHILRCLKSDIYSVVCHQ